MITNDQIQELFNSGGTVIGNDGEKIGKFGQIFLDDQTGNPEWVTVRTGLFGMSESFVPLGDASVRGDEVHVPYDKQTVKDAPRIDDAEGHLSPADEQELYRYYNRSYGQAEQLDDRVGNVSAGTLPADPDELGRTDRDFDRDATAGLGERTDRNLDRDTADGSMTRSEEELHVGTERVESGKVRLRKYVVTENVSTTVPVSHEEVRLEREPITDPHASGTISDGLQEEEQEVTLHEERPVVEKEAVPVERVRLDTETVTEDQPIEEEMRKERIETEGATGEGIDPDGTGLTDRRDR